jgi:hypothetical protein
MYRRPTRAFGFRIYPFHATRGLFAKMRRLRTTCLSHVKAGSAAMRKAPVMQRLRFVARLDAAQWL